MEKMKVDVGTSIKWHKENGRLAPADKKDYAALKGSVKIWGCPKCKIRIERSTSVFGEGVPCKECGEQLVEMSGWL
jgi:hypothetical protein